MSEQNPLGWFHIFVKEYLFKEFPTTIAEYIRLFDIIRRSAGHENAYAIERLNDGYAVQKLKENVLGRLTSAKRFDSMSQDSAHTIGNDILSLLQLMRYFNISDSMFFQDIDYYTQKYNLPFVIITQQRIQDVLLRGTTTIEMLDMYHYYGERRARDNDLEGSADSQWRYSGALIKRGELDAADRLLRSAISTLQRKYPEHHLVKKMPTESKQDKMGNIFRYLGKIHRLKGLRSNLLSLTTYRSEKEFSDARRLLHIALDLYRNMRPMKQVHGMANSYYELALVEVGRGLYMEENLNSFYNYLDLAKTHYRMAGDIYKTKLCGTRRIFPGGIFSYDE